MYRVTYSKDAEKFIKKLPRETQERILGAMDRARIRPEHFFERLVGERVYRVRVGDYRIIADIANEQLIILVINVGHRKNVYDR